MNQVDRLLGSVPTNIVILPDLTITLKHNLQLPRTLSP